MRGTHRAHAFLESLLAGFCCSIVDVRVVLKIVRDKWRLLSGCERRIGEKASLVGWRGFNVGAQAVRHPCAFEVKMKVKVMVESGHMPDSISHSLSVCFLAAVMRGPHLHLILA